MGGNLVEVEETVLLRVRAFKLLFAEPAHLQDFSMLRASSFLSWLASMRVKDLSMAIM